MFKRIASMLLLLMAMSIAVCGAQTISIGSTTGSSTGASAATTWDLNPSFNCRVDAYCSSFIVYKDVLGNTLGTDTYNHGGQSQWGTYGSYSFYWSINWPTLTASRKPSNTFSIDVVYMFLVKGFGGLPQVELVNDNETHGSVIGVVL